MIKLFWVGDDEWSQDENIQIKVWEINWEDSWKKEVEHEEVWQIALDVLENHENVYILAPVAWIELTDIDISVHETTLTISGVRNKPAEFYEHAIEVKNAECFWKRK